MSCMEGFPPAPPDFFLSRLPRRLPPAVSSLISFRLEAERTRGGAPPAPAPSRGAPALASSGVPPLEASYEESPYGPSPPPAAPSSTPNCRRQAISSLRFCTPWADITLVHQRKGPRWNSCTSWSQLPTTPRSSDTSPRDTPKMVMTTW